MHGLWEYGTEKAFVFDDKLIALQMKVPSQRIQFLEITSADFLALMEHLRFFFL